MFRAAPGFWFGGGETSNKISHMKVVYCNGVAKISGSGGGDIQQKCTHQRLLKNFENIIINLHKNSPKHFINKI